MRRLLVISAACAAVVLLFVAAPALSVRPYVPKPKESELAPAAVTASAASGRGVLSRPLRAPHRFNVVGFRWSGGGEPDVELRVRRDGGRWSRWVDVGTHPDEGPDEHAREREAVGLSAPVWAGQADWVQYRSSRRLPGLRLHFVNSTGTATAADRARTAVRQAAGKGTAAAATVLGAVVPGASAGAEQPSMVTRDQWGGSQFCPPRKAPSYGTVKAAFVHHTVSANEYSAEDAPGVVLGICRYHRISNGWDDMGYYFLVDKYGTLYEGRAGGVDRAVIGAHTQGFNSQAFAVSNIGNHEAVPQGQAALRSMARLIGWKLPHHGASTQGEVTLVSSGGASNRWPAGTPVELNRISGHRDGNKTACPGTALYAQLPELRDMVGNVVAGPTARPTLRASASKTRIVGRRRVRIDGTIDPAKPRVYVRVERRVSRGRYIRVGTLPETASTGAFRSYWRFSRPGLYRFRVIFAGDADHADSRSAAIFVRALPRGGGVSARR